VTAADEGYLHIAMDAIGRTQRLFPRHLIYFYDLSLSPAPGRADKIHDLCHVIYRAFNYSRYPKHVKKLKLYAFKALLVHEVMLDHRGVFWIDSSIRFSTSDLTGVYDQLIANGGLLTFSDSRLSIFAGTHAGMYRYLPMPAKRASKSKMLEATGIFFYRTKEIYDHVIGWWFLCALEHDCIASSHVVQPCGFGPMSEYAGCHRFDQAALNILAENYFHYNQTLYLLRTRGVYEIVRYSQHQEKLQVCSVSYNKSANYF